MKPVLDPPMLGDRRRLPDWPPPPIEGARRVAVDLLPHTLGARRTLPVCPPLHRLSVGARRDRLKDDPLSVGARRLRPTWLVEALGARRKPLDALPPTRLFPTRGRERDVDEPRLRGRAVDLDARCLEDREPRLTLGARRDPPDFEREAWDDPLTRRFPSASVGSAAVVRISTNAEQETSMRFRSRAFTSHLQTGHDARCEQVILTPR